MKLAAIALAGLALAAAGTSAAASSQVSDVDFLKANRCKGIAAGVGADTAGVDAFIKTQGASRLDYVLDKGHEEYLRAKRQTSDANMKDRLNAELATSCTAYMGASAKTVRTQ